MRIGLMEMKHFCQEFFEGVKEETFLEQSAGVADVITSCKLIAPALQIACGSRADQAGLGGRNMRVASAFAAQPGKVSLCNDTCRTSESYETCMKAEIVVF